MSKKSKRERARRLLQRKVIIIVVSILVVLCLGVWGISYFLSTRGTSDTKTTSSSDDDKKAATRTAQAKQDGDLQESAQQAIDSGNVAQVDSVYQQAVNSSSDTTRKIQLYINQSEILYNAGQTKAAIEAAEKATTVTNDQYLVADWLSRIYEDQGDYTNAAKYYRLAGDWAGSSTNESKLTKTYYETQAKRVEALAKEKS